MKSIFITRIGVALALGVSVAGATGCSGTGAGRLQETPPPTEAARLLAVAYHASAVANAMDRIVARDRRFDVDPENGFNRSGTSGMLLPGSDDASGSGEVIISQSSAEGGFVTSSVPWRDDGQLEFYVEITPYDQEEGGVLATRYIDTSYRRGAFEGFTTSGAAVSDHGLGAGWQALQATNVYEGGGTLTVRLYTDVDDADILDRPWANKVFERQEARHDIVLDDVSPLPAGRDWRSISIPARGLAGSLDGTEGRFSCLDAGCSLDNERLLPDWEGYHPGYDGSNVVIFTPADGGPPVLLAGSDSRHVPEGNYLTFGNWVYAPEDASDVDAFEVGVFAAGRDPFTPARLMALAGAASYSGKAAGLYAIAARPAAGSFTANVTLTADFAASSDFGAVSGQVSGFALENGDPSPLSDLRLLPTSIGDTGVAEPAAEPATPLPGGWVEGETAASGGWHGVWGGRFFGNGVGDQHPSSFAGTFGATDGNRRFAGGFGAYISRR